MKGKRMRTQNDWKVLIIDDEPGILNVMRVVLEDEGYTVVTASDGESGIQCFMRESPELVITDIRMPGIDGIEILRRIKAIDPEKEVIVTTAFNDLKYAISALQLDASDFITKPISDEGLVVALKRARERYIIRKELKDYTTLIEERWMETAEELARTFHTQKLLIESSIDGIIAVDKDERVVIFNRSMEQMLGYSKSEVTGQKILHQLFCPGDYDKFRRMLASGDFGTRGRLFLPESCLVASDGTRIPVQLSAAMMIEEGKQAGIVCFCRDEREIRKLAQEVVDQARMLHQDKMISLGRLSASVVHEINNPLAGILNYARLMTKMLTRGGFSQENVSKFQGYLLLMESELERCSKIVSNLLAFSRKSKLEFGPVDICDLLNKCINLSGHKMALQNIRVETKIAPDLPMIEGDFNQLQQCVINLIFNAIDAMPGGGVLTLCGGFNASKGLVSIQVRDTGCGIAKEDLVNIFDPFYTTKKEGKGIGLGLSTTFGIIDKHKGTIHVESEPGKGTCFEMELPLCKQAIPGGSLR